MNPLALLEQPESPLSRYAKLAQLRDMVDQRKVRALQMQAEEMRLADLMQAQKDNAAKRAAYKAGTVPGKSAPVAQGSISLPQLTGGQVALPGGMVERPAMAGAVGGGAQTVATPPRQDRAAILSSLQQNAPHLAPEMEASFSKSDFDQQKQALEIRKLYSEADEAQRKAIKESLELTGQILTPVKNATPEMRPQVYAHVIAMGKRQGAIPPDFPEQYPGDFMLEQQWNQAMSVKEQVDAADREQQRKQAAANAAETARHNKATEGLTRRGQDLQNQQAEARIAAGEGRKVQLTRKDITASEQKLTNINLAKKQLQQVKEKFQAIKNSVSAGPGGSLMPTPSGQAFDKAVDAMRNTLTSITRVPGVGSMSDYETRLQQAVFPSRGNYENVTEQQIQQIDDMLSLLETGYRDMLADAPNREAMQQRRVGDTKTFPNGKVGKWDGEGWVLQQ